MSPKPSSRASSSASSSRGFDKELAALEALAESVKAGVLLSADAVEQLRKTLANRPDLLAHAKLSDEDRRLLASWGWEPSRQAN